MVWDATQPPNAGALLSAPIRDNFAALNTTLMRPSAAIGQVLISQGAGLAPIWSTDPAIRNLLVNGGAVGTSGVGVLAFGPGTVPTTSPVDTVQCVSVDLFSEAGSRGLRLRDERGGLLDIGTVTTTGTGIFFSPPGLAQESGIWLDATNNMHAGVWGVGKSLNLMAGGYDRLTVATDGRVTCLAGGLYVGAAGEIKIYTAASPAENVLQMTSAGGHIYYMIGSGTGSTWSAGGFTIFDATANKIRLQWDGPTGILNLLLSDAIGTKYVTYSAPDSAGTGYRIVKIAN